MGHADERLHDPDDAEGPGSYFSDGAIGMGDASPGRHDFAGGTQSGAESESCTDPGADPHRRVGHPVTGLYGLSGSCTGSCSAHAVSCGAESGQCPVDAADGRLSDVMMTHAEWRWHEHVIQRCSDDCPHCRAIGANEPFSFQDEHQRALREDWPWMEMFMLLLTIIVTAWAAGYPPWWFLIK